MSTRDAAQPVRVTGRLPRALTASLCAAGLLGTGLFLFGPPPVEVVGVLNLSRDTTHAVRFGRRTPGVGGVSLRAGTLWVGAEAGTRSRKLFDFPDDAPPRRSFDVDGDLVLAWADDLDRRTRRCWAISRGSGAARELSLPWCRDLTPFDGAVITVTSSAPDDGRRIYTLRRHEIIGGGQEVLWEGPAELEDPTPLSEGLVISVRRGGEPSLLYLRRGSNDVRELRFPAVRPVEVQGRLTWLEQDPAGEQWLVRTGDPRSGEVTETIEIAPHGLSPALISDGRRLYLATLPYDSTPVITLREVLPGGKLRTLTSRIPWFARHWVQDGLLYTVAREDRVKWWEWFRSRGGDREQWTLMRYRLPRN